MHTLFYRVFMIMTIML